MSEDPYAGFAERYDWMRQEDPARRRFFHDLFARASVKRVLDCACGTGRDLILFHELGCDVIGSDLSAAMLQTARRNLDLAGLAHVPLVQRDLRHLSGLVDRPLDAVTCLSNAINELLGNEDALEGLRSMRSVLRPGGVLVLDQGQTDATMADPPRFAPVVNCRDYTRVLVMDYDGDVQTVHVLDFIHTASETGFESTAVRIKIRLRDTWQRLLDRAGYQAVTFFGDWHGTPYDERASARLIAVARNPAAPGA